MQAGQSACSCPECGTVCRGLFEGCPDVWARGPRPVLVAQDPDDVLNGAPLRQPAALASTGRAELHSGERPAAPILATDPERKAARVDTERTTPDVGGIRRANAARIEAARVGAGRATAQGDFPPTGEEQPDPKAAAQAEADRAAGQTGPYGESEGGRGTGSTGNGANGATTTGPNGTGHDTNGRPALGGGTSSSSPDPRTDVLRWFEEAFAGLRHDLREVVTGMTQQQAMIAELMDARQADLRLVVVAEGLPDVVQDAVEAAVADHTTELSERLETALAQVRQSVTDAEASSATAVAEIRAAVEAGERSATAAAAEIRAAVEAGERTTTAALEDSRRLQDEAEHREALRARALKASFTRQLGPLADALQRVEDTTDRRMDGINARLDAMAMQARPVRAAAKKSATAAKKPATTTKRATAAKKAPAKRAVTVKGAATPKAATKRAAPAKVTKRALAAAPAPTPLAPRRQPLRGLRTLQERG